MKIDNTHFPAKQLEIHAVKTVWNYLPAALFGTTAVFLLFAYLGANGLQGSEDRWAVVVKEMLASGDFFHPTINGMPYFDKPLLSYWLIALASKITGRLDETIVRLPSAVAALLALWATVRLGRKLFPEKQVLTAGWVLLSTYGFMFWARSAEADMENLAAIVLAVAWYWSRREKPGFFSYLIFYLICFTGAHAKGMATIVVPAAVILPDVLRKKRWRSYLPISHFLAVCVGLAVYMAPFVMADTSRESYQASGLWFAFKENITRYFKPFDHNEPFYVYFMYVPRLFFPWVVLLVGTIIACWENFRKFDWPTKWLTLSTVIIFLVFTLSGSRRSYYILPILPFCALLVSQYLEIEKNEQRKKSVLSIQVILLVVILMGEILSPALWPFIEKKTHFIPPHGFKMGTLAMGLLALTCFVPDIFRNNLMARLLGVPSKLVRPITVSLILLGGFFLWQQRALEPLQYRKSFSLKLKNELSSLDSSDIAFFRRFKPKMVFYLDRPDTIPILKNISGLQEFGKSKEKPWILISETRYENEIASVIPQNMGHSLLLEEDVYAWERDSKKEQKYKAWIINGHTQ